MRRRTESGPLQKHEAEGVLVLGPGSCLSRESSRQSLQVEVLEPGVGIGARMDLGEVDALGVRQHGTEHVVAADHHDFVDTGILRGAARMRERLLQAAGDNGAGRHRPASRESTILTRWSRTRRSD